MPTQSPIDELAAVAGPKAGFRLVSEFDLPRGKSLWVHIYDFPPIYLTVREMSGGNPTFPALPKPKTVADALRAVAAAYPKATLRPDSIKVKTAKGAAAKLKSVAVQAWHEALGLPIPSLDEIAAQRKTAKAARKSAADDTLSLLKTGAAGVKAYNRRTPEERNKTDLHNADLAGCDLAGIQFGAARLDGADLSGANLAKARFEALGHAAKLIGATLVGADLTEAWLGGSNCSKADFSQAKLTGANLWTANFQGATFAGADLSGAGLVLANLRGADLSTATVKGTDFARARFDEQTKWPKGFQIPADLQWKGAGADPRLAPSKREKKLPPPADFAGFLERLQNATDAAKLGKAMSMLKADRFRLFAKVEPEHLTGVVKSQSDASLVYSCRLKADGTYSCCTQNLNVCGGLRGSPCKHLLVLIVGLTKAGELDPATAHAWTQSSRGRKPELDKDAMTETLLQYKGAEAGEVDWRPTETIPEDFYAM